MFFVSSATHPLEGLWEPALLRTWAKGEGQGRLSCPDLIAWEASGEKPVRPGGVELLPAFVG